jgi:hypothetical protein
VQRAAVGKVGGDHVLHAYSHCLVDGDLGIGGAAGLSAGDDGSEGGRVGGADFGEFGAPTRRGFEGRERLDEEPVAGR